MNCKFTLVCAILASIVRKYYIWGINSARFMGNLGNGAVLHEHHNVQWLACKCLLREQPASLYFVLTLFTLLRKPQEPPCLEQSPGDVVMDWDLASAISTFCCLIRKLSVGWCLHRDVERGAPGGEPLVWLSSLKCSRIAVWEASSSSRGELGWMNPYPKGR